jgi:hypothetical protein
MLVIVTTSNPPELVKVEGATNETQARWDAYCWATNDPSPQEDEVNKHTSIATPHTIQGTPADAD